MASDLYCTACGADVPEGARFCPQCGRSGAGLPVRRYQPAGKVFVPSGEQHKGGAGRKAFITVSVIVGALLLIGLISEAVDGPSSSAGNSQSAPAAPPKTGLAACGDDDRAIVAKQLAPPLQRFTDALQLADSTPRIVLAGPISQMQAARRDFGGVTAPHCVQDSVALTYTAMDTYISAYTAFMGQANQATVQQQLDQAGSELQQAEAALH